MNRSILILNGPNLNMLGKRQPEIYGHETLADVERACIEKGKALGLEVECRQSNSQGELVTWIQEARETRAGLIINAGAYTHTSLAMLDAINAAEVPVIEIHISNIHQRESFRHHSYISLAAVGMICGFGTFGYQMALDAIANHIGKG